MNLFDNIIIILIYKNLNRSNIVMVNLSDHDNPVVKIRCDGPIWQL